MCLFQKKLYRTHPVPHGGQVFLLSSNTYYYGMVGLPFFIFDWNMAARVIIDLENVYDLEVFTPDLKLGSFRSRLENGDEVLLNIRISSVAHELLPSVYNLAFGPVDKKGNIIDRIELRHIDYSKVFSTILLSVLTYFKQNQNHFLGVDGSDNNRAYFYYRAMMRNFEYLNRRFDMDGIKYFVRISRFGKTQYDNPFDFDDIKPESYKITVDHQISQYTMYNYFIFGLKNASKKM
jgi:hypothetical protein